MKTPRKLDVIHTVGRWTRALLVTAALLTLVGLALMVWSLAQPTPMPVILAMSLGQGVGILAFVLFGAVVLVDQLRKQREAALQELARSNGVAAAAPVAPSPAAPSPAAPPPPSPEASP